ncbi:hypothetical protein M378DRAFT_748469 [Amanita muscaria Koide BX008]|uniref:Uncharacterized protein n=1 Tax=Amanita muscaria (strain Koide BX008) TaxID=946122 RepID=A0A0C2WMB8_AMAMK|nr:hypothetical protein M378DRAFT_748469 [Amanita muscaria Koide BX008]
MDQISIISLLRSRWLLEIQRMTKDLPVASTWRLIWILDGKREDKVRHGLEAHEDHAVANSILVGSLILDQGAFPTSKCVLSRFQGRCGRRDPRLQTALT